MYTLQELMAAIDRLNQASPDERKLDFAVAGKRFFYATTGEWRIFLGSGCNMSIMLADKYIATFRVVGCGSDYAMLDFVSGNDGLCLNMIRYRS